MTGKRFTDIDSSLETREQVAEAARALLDPLKSHFSPGRTCVKLGNTATRYDEIGAQVEGYARPLWGLAALLAGGQDYEGTDLWVDGLRNGTNPEHPEFWGWMRDLDQRMVECCPLGYCLCIAGHKFWDPLSPQEKDNVAAWLNHMNNKEMPNTNWLWFRVFANMGLAKNGAPYSQEKMEADMDHLDSFYRDEGFSNDGPAGYTQMDYYSGSFAIQFLQLLYVKIWGDRDPKRAEAYRERARLYAAQFVHYADPQGRLITFGRSLTYRFAMAGFWGAVAFADLELPAPLTWGVVKGLLLRNLRYWTKQKEILTSDGTLSIGYCYPNQFMSENYNSPGSPYWFMLSFAPLSLPNTHPFWTSTEAPFPSTLPPIRALPQPLHILSSLGGHTFLLSSGQMCHYPVRASESKYGKFAYSSAFAYSVPTGGYFIEAVGGDNVLAVTEDEQGMGEIWRVRRVATGARIVPKPLEGAGKEGPVLESGWAPFKEDADADVSVKTWLIPPTEDAPNWHIRVHRISSVHRDLRTSEGAWALAGVRASDGRELETLDLSTPSASAKTEQSPPITPVTVCNLNAETSPMTWRGPFKGTPEEFKTRLEKLQEGGKLEVCSYSVKEGEAFVIAIVHVENWLGVLYPKDPDDEKPNDYEGVHAKPSEALAVTSAGAVGIVELSATGRTGRVLAADANGNLMAKRAVLPSLEGEVKAGETKWWITAVFAMPESVEGWEGKWREGWEKRPKVPGWVEEMIR